MCDCNLCRYNRKISSILPALPAEQSELFALVLENYNDVGMDLDYSRAVVEGVWPSADEVIAHARSCRALEQESPPLADARNTVSARRAPGDTFHDLAAVPEQHRADLSELVLRHSLQFEQLKGLEAIIDGSDPDADEKLENARARRAQLVGTKAQGPGAPPLDGESRLYQRVWVVNDEAGVHVMTCPEEPSKELIASLEARIAKTCSVTEYLLLPAGTLNNPVYQYRYRDMHEDPADDGRWSTWKTCTLDAYKQAKEAADAGRGNQVRILYALA